MADIRKNLKALWIKGMSAVGNTASNIASNTRFKVDEMSMVNRRSEILNNFGAKAYALWQKGEHFPEELENELRELGGIDEKLNDLRAERIAGIKAVEAGRKAKKETPGDNPTENGDPEITETDEESYPDAAEDTDDTEASETDPEAFPEDAFEPGDPETAEPGDHSIPEETDETEVPEDGGTDDAAPAGEQDTAEAADGPEESKFTGAEPDESIPVILTGPDSSAEEAAENPGNATNSPEDELKEFNDAPEESAEELSPRTGEGLNE